MSVARRAGFALFFSIAALGTWAGCKPRVSASLRHELGEISQQSSPLSWVALPYPKSRLPRGFFPQDAPRTVLLQKLVTRLDVIARKEMNSRFAAEVPSPVVALIDDETSVNAVVATVDSVFEVPTGVLGKGQDREQAPRLAFHAASRKFFAGRVSSGDVKRAFLLPELVTFVQEALRSQQTKVTCEVVTQETGLAFSESCFRDKALNANSLAIQTTSNLIKVNSGIFALKNVGQAIALLAHELGHFYRAHGTAANMYEAMYFYEMDASNMGVRPRRGGAEIQELGKELEVLNKKRVHSPADKERLELLRKRAHELRLGFYSAEQEADEIGLELLSRMGYSYRHALELRFDHFRSQEGEPGFAQCRQMVEEQLNSGKKFTTYVFPGDFGDPHHSDCFRAFLVAIEAVSHGYSSETSHREFDSEWVQLAL